MYIDHMQVEDNLLHQMYHIHFGNVKREFPLKVLILVQIPV